MLHNDNLVAERARRTFSEVRWVLVRWFCNYLFLFSAQFLRLLPFMPLPTNRGFCLRLLLMVIILINILLGLKMIMIILYGSLYSTYFHMHAYICVYGLLKLAVSPKQCEVLLLLTLVFHMIWISIAAYRWTWLQYWAKMSNALVQISTYTGCIFFVM